MSTDSDHRLAVHHSVSVPLTAQRTFDLFTGRMADFWPASHTIGTAPFVEIRVEPREGGRWFEIGDDGSECTWGRVATWSPPERLVLVWQIGAEWTYDPTLETEVEITFTEQDAGTRVDLTHRGFEQYGDQAEAMRAVYGADGGWPGILERLVSAAAGGR